MKTNRILRVTKMTAACLCFIATGIKAQPVTPFNSNNVLLTTSNQIYGINTAEIAGGAGYIFATVYYDGSGTEVYAINDPANTGTTSITQSSSGNFKSVPDLALGNSTGTGICATCNTATDYILACAYADISSNLIVDFYQVHDDGTTLTSAFLSGATITISGYVPVMIHVDAVADYSGVTPVCHKFMLSWVDNTTPTQPVALVTEVDFNAGSYVTPIQINPAGSYVALPDVAGIQVNVGTLGAPSIHDVALVTYLNSSLTELYTRAYDFTGSSYSTQKTLDNGSTSTTLGTPRIDAIDDYHNNNSGTKANWEVACPASVSGPKIEVREYDNKTTGHNTPSGIIDIHTVSGYGAFSPPYPTCTLPVVSVGSDGSSGYNYSILHYMEYTASHDIVFMEPYNYASPGTLVGSNYYWVNGNSTPANIDAYNGFASATSSAPNDYTQPTVYAWAFYDPGSADYEIDYKISSSSAYSFRQSPSISHTSANVADAWHIYPNPAFDQLEVTAGQSSHENVLYSITDMAGRTVLQGTVVNGTAQISVSSLAAGTYVLQLKGDGAGYHELFVKE